MRKILLLASFFLSTQAHTQSFTDISTGVSNTTGYLLGNYSLDDTWKVYMPGSTTAIAPVVLSATAYLWPVAGCAKWISPSTFSVPPGDYTYEAKFQIPCATSNPSLVLDVYACDNTFVDIQINNHVVPFISGNLDDLALRYNYVISNLAPYVSVGMNTLKIRVHNRGTSGSSSGTQSGLVVCGKINFNAAYSNNPQFTLSQPQPSTISHFYRAATPVVTNANLAPGFGEMYIIEQMSYDEQVVFSITSQGSNPNPSCWWVYPNPVIFRGYNSTQNVTNLVPCKMNGIGKFSQCYKYRITRGTWNSYCPWRQYSLITVGDTCNLRLGSTGETLYTVDTHAPDFSYMKPAQPISENFSNATDQTGMVSPNPGNGIFVLKTSHIRKGVIGIYDLNGLCIRRIKLMNNKGNTRVDISNYAPGIYTARIVTDEKVFVERIMVIK
jgi:hypothetical protein